MDEETVDVRQVMRDVLRTWSDGDKLTADERLIDRLPVDIFIQNYWGPQYEENKDGMPPDEV